MLRSPTTSTSSPNLASITRTPGSVENITQRKRKQPESEITNAINSLTKDIDKKFNELRCYIDCTMSKLSDNITSIKTDLASVTQATSEIKNELSSLRLDHVKLEKHVTALEDKHNTLIQDITGLQNSLQNTSDLQGDLQKQVDSITMKNVSKDIFEETVLGLEIKIDTLEQQARQCNVEICNVPERRSENLITLMENISTKINCSINQRDIIAIHRVPHAHKESNKPKNIVVKLSSRILRDNLLSAFRLAKGVKTDQLGISGTVQSVYMNEHLTLKNKRLFRTCREAANKNNFKFVWVKHATILVREKDGTPAMAIRSPQDISKIIPSAVSTNST